MPISDLEQKRKKALESGFTPEQIMQYERSKGINVPMEKTVTKEPSRSTDTNVDKKRFDDTLVGRNAPVIGDILGGFAGPVGAGAGYSIGDSLKNIIPAVGQLADATKTQFSKGPQLTPYAQQRLEQRPDLDVDLGGDDFKFGRELLGNLAGDPRYSGAQEEAGKFAINNLLKSTVAGGTDYAFGKTFDFLGRKVGGKLYDITGWRALTPKGMASAADEAAETTWKAIEGGLDEAEGAGKILNVEPALAKLTNHIDELKSTFKGGEKLPQSILDEIAGYQKVIDEIESASKLVQDGDNVVLALDPKAGQKLKSIFGKTSTSPVTKLGKVSSDVEQSAELTSKRIAGPEIREELVKLLDEVGVEDSRNLYNTYGTLTNFSDIARNKPLAGALPAGVVGTLGANLATLLGFGLPGAAMSLGSAGLMMPVGRQYLRTGLKGGLEGGQTALRAVIGSILNSQDDRR